VTYVVGTARIIPLAGDMWDPVYETATGVYRVLPACTRVT
jgi:hypothetical protein